MNDIIKLILLNLVLIYFVYKKNKIIYLSLLIIIFIYYLYLRSNNIEGQSLEEAKSEVKFMKMANIDRLLSKLLNIYQHSEEDCIGGYSEFSECDKKCGITHKYKTYVVENQGGILGNSCIENDGRRKKKLCDKSDGVYPCVVGEFCQEDGDCETNNCEPKTDKCVEERVCSNTNLDLCNKEDCINLNINYDYAEREFQYDEAESGIKCKLEEKKGNNNNNNNNNNGSDGAYDISSLPDAQCESEYFLKKSETMEGLADECQLKMPNSVYFETDDDPGLVKRNETYGKPMVPGLYCKIGYKYYPDIHAEDDIDENLGVFEPIPEDVLLPTEETTDDLGKYCKDFIRNDKSTPVVDKLSPNHTCVEGYWPPLSYFINKDNLNLGPVGLGVPIDEMCKRCDNGFKKVDETCMECTEFSSLGKIRNQYKKDNLGYRAADGGYFGKKTDCNIPSSPVTPTTLKCGELREGGMKCPDNMAEKSGDSTATTYRHECCEQCPRGTRVERGAKNEGEGSKPECTPCPAGKEQDRYDATNCAACPVGEYSSLGPDGCQKCGTDAGIPNRNKNGCGNYCTKKQIIDGDCKKIDPISDSCANDPNQSEFNPPCDDYSNALEVDGFYETCCEPSSPTDESITPDASEVSPVPETTNRPCSAHRNCESAEHVHYDSAYNPAWDRGVDPVWARCNQFLPVQIQDIIDDTLGTDAVNTAITNHCQETCATLGNVSDEARYGIDGKASDDYVDDQHFCSNCCIGTTA